MSVETIHQKILNNTNDNFDKSLGSWTYDIEKAVAIELNEHVVLTDDIIDKINIENLTGDELTRFIFQRTGVMRVAATKASGTVLIKATNATVVNVGDLFAADDVFYEATETTTITAPGQYRINVQAVEFGSGGNVPVGAINAFPTTLVNVATVTNESAFENGFPEETDASLRQRYYDKLQRPGKAGNKYHYREWAQSVAGVGKVKVFPRWDGPLTVKVAVLDVDNELASTQLITDVFDYIETERPFGADVTVVTGEALEIDVSATFTFKNGYAFAQVEAFIKEKLTAYFKTIAFDEDLTYISQAQIGRELLSVEGIEDYANLTLNGSTGNIPISEIQVPTIRNVVNV